MSKKNLRFKCIDALYIIMMILPLLCAMLIQVFTKGITEGINVTGAAIFCEIPAPIQPILVTEAQVNSLLVLISIFFLCLFMVHGISENITLKRQHIAELIVEKVDGLVESNMGDYFKDYSPFVIAILALSAFSSLLSLLGLFPPTSDVNVVGGWAMLVFILITYYKLKSGFLNYLKGFTEPVVVLAPINIIGEFATPISMSFRHYGNVLSGTVVSTLVAAGLSGLSAMVLKFLPGALAEFPLFRIGLPAVLSIYFDVFSGCLQAFIFAMLTMMNISGAFSIEDYEKRKLKKQNKKTK